MPTYYEVTATIDGEKEVLFGSFVRGDCTYEIESEKASWVADGYRGIKIESRETEETPDPEVYKLDGLNDQEVEVLKACLDNAQDAAGGDFGFTDELDGYLEGMTTAQIKGYLGSLVKKGYIYTDAYTTEESSGHQITFPKDTLVSLLNACVITEDYAKQFEAYYQ